ncbi:MAG: arylsulfotransferase family protein [Eubacteriaceae bacterium]
MDSSRKFMAVTVGVAVLLIILVSCTLAYAGRDNTLMSDKSLHFEINGYSTELPLSEDGAVFDPVSMKSEKENEIKLLNEVGANVKINDKGIGAGKTINLKLDSLSENNLIKIEVSNEKDKRTVYLRSLSSQLPKMLAAGESETEGNYYGTLTNTPALFELNQKGEVVFYVAKNKTEFPNETYWNFKKHVLENGDIRYSYYRGTIKGEGSPLTGSGSGKEIILDENYRKLKSIVLNKDEDLKESAHILPYDFIMLEDDHYIVMGYQLELVNNIPPELNPNPLGTKVVSNIIQEVKEKETLFQFISGQHPELYQLSAEGNAYGDIYSEGEDYCHVNAITIDPKDENLVVSLRNANTIMKIDRKTGEILWKLSGNADEFGLSPEQKTFHQNDVRITEDGEMTIFDDGNGPGQTRVLQLKLDEVNKKVLEYQEYKIPGYSSQGFGSAQKISNSSGVYAIGWGENLEGDAFLTEFDFLTGKKHLEVTMPLEKGTYRVQKIQ